LPRRILLVDDRVHSRDLVASEFEEAGFDVARASDGQEAWGLFQRDSFDLVVTDLRMPRADGMTLLERVRSPESANPRVPVIMVSAFGSLSTAVAAGRRGATDFYAFDADGIEQLVRRATEVLGGEPPILPPVLAGGGEAIASLRERISVLAAIDSPVLVRGERGTGRSSVARYIHSLSPLAGGSFLRFQCDDPPEPFEPAGPTTVFLAEVDQASSELQKVLWDILAARHDQLGSTDLRVVASSSEDLVLLAAAGDFHKPLADWLSRFMIDLPPLRERVEDLDSIVDALLRQIQARDHKQIAIGKAAMERLRLHPWYENLTELTRVLECLVVFAKGSEICESQVESALSEVEEPLARISRQRAREQRKELLDLYKKHGTFAGVARELGITRNAAKYRFRKHDLLPGNQSSSDR